MRYFGLATLCYVALLAISCPIRPALAGSGDLYGDPLPPGAVARLGCMRFWLSGSAQAIEYSPDGRLIAGAADGRDVCVWDADSGRLIHRFSNSDHVISMFFDEQSSRLTAGDQGGDVYCWDVRTGREVRRISLGEDEAVVHAGSQANVHIYTFSEAGLRRWNPQNVKPLTLIADSEISLHAIAWSPDSNVIAIGRADRSIQLWDGKGDKQLRRIALGHKSTRLAFAPDGKTLAAACDDSMGLWEVITGRLLRTFPFASEPRCLAFSPDGRSLAAGGDDAVIRIWSLGAEAPPRELALREAPSSLAFSPDARRLAVGAGRVLTVWDLARGQVLADNPVHLGGIVDMTVLRDQELIATCGRDATIRYWRPDSGKQVRVRSIPERGFSAAAFSGSGQLLATADTRGITYIWDLRTMKETKRLIGFPGFIDMIAWSPNDRVVWSISSGADAFTDAWEVGSPRPGRHFLGPLRGVTTVAYSPGGFRFALARSDSSIGLWRSDSGVEFERWAGQCEALTSVAYSSDGRHLAVGCGDGRVHVWDLSTKKICATTPVRGNPEEHSVTVIAFASDGKTMAYGDADGIVRLAEFFTGRVRREFHGHRGAIGELAYLDGGRKLASASDDGTVIIWDVAEKERMGP